MIALPSHEAGSYGALGANLILCLLYSSTDMIALPAMRPGAMEHWGLITYRETALLFSPKDSAQVDKMGIATIINHEVAHQVRV